MSDFVKATPQTCAKCKYRCQIDQRITCNYLAITNHSRVLVKSGAAYDPAYCDKYEPGKQLKQPRIFNPASGKRDEINYYVAEVITDAKSTSAYYHRKLMGRSKKWDV